MWNQLKKYGIRKQTDKYVNLTKIRQLMRQTKLNDALLATTREIEIYWIYACTQFKIVHKRSKDWNGAHLIILDQAHAKVNGMTEASENNSDYAYPL